MKSIIKFAFVNINNLILNVRNTHTYNESQILQSRSFIREFGFINPVIINKQSNIFIGQSWVLAAKAEGMMEIPCVFIEHLSEFQIRAYIITNNKFTLDTEWDEEKFSNLKDLSLALQMSGLK